MDYRTSLLVLTLTHLGCSIEVVPPDTAAPPVTLATPTATPTPTPTAPPSSAPPTRPIEDILASRTDDGSLWYVFDKGVGAYAAIIGSPAYADAGEIAVALPACVEGERVSAELRAHLSIDLAPGHRAECKLVSVEGAGAVVDVPGSERTITTPGKQDIAIAAQYTVATGGDCVVRLRARAPENTGADTFAVEDWAALKVLRSPPAE